MFLPPSPALRLPLLLLLLGQLPLLYDQLPQRPAAGEQVLVLACQRVLDVDDAVAPEGGAVRVVLVVAAAPALRTPISSLIITTTTTTAAAAATAVVIIIIPEPPPRHPVPVLPFEQALDRPLPLVLELGEGHVVVGDSAGGLDAAGAAADLLGQDAAQQRRLGLGGAQEGKVAGHVHVGHVAAAGAAEGRRRARPNRRLVSVIDAGRRRRPLRRRKRHTHQQRQRALARRRLRRPRLWVPAVRRVRFLGRQ